jgi:hypothetical protein
MSKSKLRLLKIFWTINAIVWLAWAIVGKTPINPQSAPVWWRVICAIVGFGCILRYRDLTPPEVRSVRRLGRIRLRTGSGSQLIMQELRRILLTGTTSGARIAAAEAISLYPTFTGASCLAEAARNDPDNNVREKCLELLRTAHTEEAMRKVQRPAIDIKEDGRLIADLLSSLNAPEPP